MKRTVRSANKQMLIRKSKALRSELRDICAEAASDMADWLGVAVRDWVHKPRFAPRTVIRYDYVEARVDVAGSAKDIFKYVDLGTGLYGPKKRAYVIQPKTPGGMLKFQTGYSARTAPKAQIGMGTGEHFGDWVSKAKVIHPGIQPRHFSKRVAEEIDPDWRSRVKEAIDKALKE